MELASPAWREHLRREMDGRWSAVILYQMHGLLHYSSLIVCSVTIDRVASQIRAIQPKQSTKALSGGAASLIFMPSKMGDAGHVPPAELLHTAVGQGHTLLDLSALPLANAGAAGICQHSAANLLENVQEAVTRNGGADLLRAGSNGEGHLPAHTTLKTLAWL